ncbi:WD40 repeat-like protein [Setomelanomma holmii]|uniref:WD40 repeat-like protein n=1 Tax=Setomelanomma holmii TaxID=210430 RepID=A0A9P4LLB7_9PLEO|nr:WD40 repeat-like protein [Setomelanomma holmii]
MAWQSPSAMNAGGAGGGGDGNAPAGTEYTLQAVVGDESWLTHFAGVMRFLQLEWHNHERARNAWDIERAEMKAKIAKQEGEVRSAKKLNDQLNKHIRMLEQALMNERAKAKAAATGGNASAEDDKKDAKGKKGGMNAVKPQDKRHNSFLDVDSEFLDRSDADRDGLREKSKLYLTKCVEEITYLLTPPPQPPPQQPNLHALGNGAGFLNHGDASLEELQMLQYRQKLQSQSQLPTMPNTSMPNHQPPSIPTTSGLQSLANQNQIHHAPEMTREPAGQHSLGQQSSMPGGFSALRQSQVQDPLHYSSVPEEQVEKVTHTYDNNGRQIPTQEDAQPAPQTTADDPDQWTFDPEPSADVPMNGSSLGRPDTIRFPDADNLPAKSPPRMTKTRSKSGDHGPGRRLSSDNKGQLAASGQLTKPDQQSFKVRFALRGHLDVVRSVVFTGGGSPSEPEICTAGDDGMIKRWTIPASYANQHSMNNDLDIAPFWSHRGHEGAVTSLAACPASAHFATGGRVSGDGWIFSGGQDATIRVWERGRVDPKATLDGHTDAVWSVVATQSPFHHMLVHTIERQAHPSPTYISPLALNGENFVVSFSDASILVYDTRTGEELIGMASNETYDGTPATGITSVVATSQSIEGPTEAGRGSSEEEGIHGPTGSSNGGGLEGVIISGHEDQYIRFFDANSGQCTYQMLAHPSAISSLSLSKDGHEAVSAGHDASIRFWSLDKRICTQEITAHRIMRGEGVCSVVWSQDGRLVVSAGGDGIVKVFAR